jgi:hypothetical protein
MVLPYESNPSKWWLKETPYTVLGLGANPICGKPLSEAPRCRKIEGWHLTLRCRTLRNLVWILCLAPLKFLLLVE